MFIPLCWKDKEKRIGFSRKKKKTPMSSHGLEYPFPQYFMAIDCFPASVGTKQEWVWLKIRYLNLLLDYQTPYFPLATSHLMPFKGVLIHTSHSQTDPGHWTTKTQAQSSKLQSSHLSHHHPWDHPGHLRRHAWASPFRCSTDKS